MANLNANVKDSYINLAMSVDLSRIEEHFSHMIEIRETLKFNKTTKKFDLRKSAYFLALELYSKPQQLDKNHDIKKLLLELVKEEGLELLTWSKKAKSLQERVAFVNARLEESLESLSDEVLLNSLDIWLEPFLGGVKSVKALQELELYPMFLSLLSWENQQKLDLLAPQKVEVPSGSNIYIDYSDEEKPAIHVKLQEMFGLEQTPTILGGNVALQIQLLSPAMRPIQITYDISSFWANSYAEVRKELRGKYKRHYWPENPYDAVATQKTKKHMMK